VAKIENRTDILEEALASCQAELKSVRHDRRLSDIPDLRKLIEGRLNAAELGKDKIRVNVVNPDAVIAGSNIWSGGWAEGRAKAYGIKVEELPAYYAGRTLLNEIILPEDIANACYAFVGGLLSKTTGGMINVDGGVAAAFVR
jgi:enoyl-[acyl-carrier-protein] reductase (NADH)